MFNQITRRQFVALAALSLFQCKEKTALEQLYDENPVQGSDPRTVDCFGIFGQSNAHGNSPNNQLASTPLETLIPRCWIYHKPNASSDADTAFDIDNGSWQQLKCGVNNQLIDWTSYYGPELRFGYEMQSYRKRDVYLIKFAIGDTALNSESTKGKPGEGGLLDWSPTSKAELFERSIQNYWIPARDKLIAQGKIPVMKGVLFMQGERDSFISLFADNYLSNGKALAAALRKAFDNPSMHLTIGRICNEVAADRPHGEKVYTAQTKWAEEENNSLIDTDPFTLQKDNVHFADHSELGYEAFLKMKDL